MVQKLNLSETIPEFDRLVVRRREMRGGGSGFILGLPGSGNAVVKHQIASILRNTNDKVIVIDTDGDYISLPEELDGQLIHLKPGGSVHINPFDIYMHRPTEDDAPAVIFKSDFINNLFSSLFGSPTGLTAYQSSILDCCVKEIYEPFLNSKDETTGQYNNILVPQFRDLYRTLYKHDLSVALPLATLLEPFVADCMDTFSHATNVAHNKQLVVYELRDLGFYAKTTIGIFSVLEHIWNKYVLPNVCSNWDGSLVWIFIDEACWLFRSEPHFDFMRTIYKRSRTNACVLTSVTMDVSGLLAFGIGRSLVSNCDYLHTTRLSPVDQKKISELLGVRDVPEHQVGDGYIFAP